MKVYQIINRKRNTYLLCFNECDGHFDKEHFGWMGRKRAKEVKYILSVSIDPELGH